MQATLTVLQKVRQVNLKKLVEEFFGGNASEAARKLKASHQYLWQLLSGHRGMGERSAREIEEALKLAPYSLDQNRNQRDTEVELRVGGGQTKSFRYVPTHALATPEVKSEQPRQLCPIEGCSPKAFAVVADGGTEETMNEFKEGDVLFVEPFERRDKLVNRSLYVVSLVGKKASGRVLQARANGEGGWLFAPTLLSPAAKRRDIPYGDLKVIGRVKLVVRALP